MTRAALALFLSILALLVSGCRSREALPQLVTLEDVGPKTVSVGDVLEVSGAGFPAKRHAKITLAGTLHVPGRDPEPGFELECEGTSDGPTRVTVAISPDVAEGVLGKGYAALHGTFRGTIELAFASVTPGAMPITGSLSDVVLDVVAPSSRRPELEAQRAEGKHLLGEVGLDVSDQPAEHGGIAVVTVAEDSPAARAGLTPGDLLRGLDGWNLLDVADFVPSGRRKLSVLTVVAAADGRVAERQLAMEGYRPRASTDVLGVALVLGTAVVILLFFASPLSRWVSRLERAAAQRRAASVRAGRSALVAALDTVGRFVRPTADPLRDVLPFLTLLAGSALFVIAPFGKRLLGLDLDVLVVGSLVVVLHVTAAMLSGTRGTTTKYSLSRSLRLGGWVLLRHVPALVGLGCLVARVGSFALVDAVRAQGGRPWHAMLVRSPLGALELLLFLSPLLLALRSSASLAEDTLDVGVARPVRGAWLESTVALVASGAAVALWLGGWAVPFSDHVGEDVGFALQVVGAVLYLAKTWVLFLGIMVLRATLPLSTLDQASRPLLSRLLPLALFTAAGTVGWLGWDPAANVRRAVSAVLSTVFAVGVVFLARRLVTTVRASQKVPELSPFV